MIEPLKATKGRRMSKKTRKKSSRSTAGSPTAETRKTDAKKSASAAKRVTAKASHKAAAKPLKTAPSSATKAPALVEGVKAPTFHLPRDGGGHLSLDDYAGKKLVLFFYPRADTPGCTKEAIDFTRLRDEFAASGTAVLGISADPLKAQESFRNKHQLTIPLMSDEKHEILEAYGAWGEKSMYGRKFMGILRTTVLIDADLRIARIWRNVRVDGHADEVLAAARTLEIAGSLS
jgi:peroxiredoxin Q/BCP